MATTTIGAHTVMNIKRIEGDTNDINVYLTNDDGTPATVTGWTAVLSIGQDEDTPLSPPKTYNGTGVSNPAGTIPINMNGFDVPPGSYKYDVRVRDTVTGDTPERVYFKGSFTVGKRIN